MSSICCGEDATRPRFEVYYRIRLATVKPAAAARRRLTKLASIDKKEIEELQARFRYVEEDAAGPYVLTTDQVMLSSLTAAGWECAIDDSCLIAEAQRIEDFKQLLGCAVEVLYDEAWLDQEEARIRAGLVARFGVNHPQLEVYAQNELAQVNPDLYFDWLEGRVDLQEEVIFSDFIREAKRMQHDGLSAFIERLSMWYGEGIYAEVFDRRGGVDVSKYRCIVWDFKPIWRGAALRHGAPWALCLRIQVYCDSVVAMHLCKVVG